MKKKSIALCVWALVVVLACSGALSGIPDGHAAALPWGGKNLLLDSGREYASSGGLATVDVFDALEDSVGKRVTVSFDIKGWEGQTILVSAYQSSGVSLFFLEEGEATLRLEKDGEYARYSFTALVKNYGPGYSSDGVPLTAGALAFTDAAQNKRDFSVRMVKLELGNHATAWNLNPDDPALGVNLLSGGAAAMAAVNRFTQAETRDALTPYIGYPVCVSFDVASASDGRLAVYPYQNSGVSIAESFSFRLTADAFAHYTLSTRVKDFGQQKYENGNDMTAGSIGFYFYPDTEGMNDFTIRNLKIELGQDATPFSFAPQDPMAGRNLLTDSGRERTTINGFVQYLCREDLKNYVGSEVTVSFEAKGDPSAVIGVYGYQSSGISILAQPGATAQFKPAAHYRHYAFIMDVTDFGQQYSPQGQAYSTGSIALYNFAADHSDFSVRNVKVELGRRATAWSIAPNDPAHVSSVEEALSYLKSCRSNKLLNFTLYPDAAVQQALSANRFYAFRRLLAQAGYALGSLLETDEGCFTIRGAVLGPVECGSVQTAEALTAYLRQAVQRNLSSFSVLLTPELFNSMRANNWAGLYRAEADAGIGYRDFSYYAEYGVLCYESVRGK